MGLMFWSGGFCFSPLVVDIGILRMDFHLAHKDINRYQKESLSWPSVHLNDYLLDVLMGRVKRAEMPDG